MEGNPDPHFAEPRLSSASARFPAAERPRAVAPETYIETVRSAQQLQERQEREQHTQGYPEHDGAAMGPLHSAVGALASRSTSGGLLRTLCQDPPRRTRPQLRPTPRL